MKQQQFEIRHRSKSVLKEVVEMWQQGNQKENLEGIDQDPIFGLLISALAYRTNEIENNIEELKVDIIEELSKRLIPKSVARAKPASAIITTSLLGNIGERELTSSSQFTLSGSQHHFVPLFDTRIINGVISSVTRVDGRRWSVRIDTKVPISTLRGVSFLLNTAPFEDLTISLDGHELPVIKPWDFANLPISKSLSAEGLFYNREELFVGSNLWFDIFSQLNSKLFYIDHVDSKALKFNEREHLDLQFEFSGIDESFEFVARNVKINALPLVNIEERWVDLSTSTPIMRLVTSTKDDEHNEFLGLIPPADSSDDYVGSVSLRTVGADRYNATSLLHLADSLYNRFSSDYYAFNDLVKLRDGKRLQQLHKMLEGIAGEVNRTIPAEDYGHYLMLNRNNIEQMQGRSFRVRYISTAADKINKLLNRKSQFTPAKTLSLTLASCEMTPLLGVAAPTGEEKQRAIAKYNVITQDRLVTPADIKAFCANELATKYGIYSNSIVSLRVSPKLHVDKRITKYVMEVQIKIAESFYIKHTMLDIKSIEIQMARKMAVRSCGVHPFNVSIQIV